jgi:bifunctional non-homologous end joining protein LigD
LRTAPRLTHLEKVLWPPSPDAPGGFSKGDFVRYLAAVAPYALPHLADRPLVLTRYPHGIDGVRFYQKNLPDTAPAWLARFPHASGSGRVVRYLVARAPEDLVWLGQQAAIEFHPWLARTDDPAHPDRAVIDLDPMPPAGFEDARDVARVVAGILAWARIRFWVKTSGATGLHFFIPIRRGPPWREVTDTIRRVGVVVAQRWPTRVTLERAVQRRGGRVYFDYLQNGPGKTLCAPYSPRPLPGAPVSMPIAWSEVERVDPSRWTLATVPRRLAASGDAWGDLPGAPGQDLAALRESTGQPSC